MGIVHRKTSVMSTAEGIELRESMDDDRANLLGGKTSSSTNKRLLSWRELPEWMKDNIYITAGYRKPTGSYFSFVLSTQCHYYKQPNSLTLSYEATLDPFTTLYQHTTLYIHIQYANIFYTIGQFHSFMGRQ